jgi:glycosyltransferase involved in cell wall biosynthesis
MQVVGTLQIGGAENQVVQLANGLLSRGVDSQLVCLTAADTPNSRAVASAVKRYVVALRKRGQLSCIARLTSLFRNVRPDVVQSHMFHTNLYTVIAARMAGVPVVITTEHGKNLWKKHIHHLLEHLVISPLADMRVAVSQDIMRIRIASGDVSGAKITVIPPCVVVPDKPVMPGNNKTLKILAIGRLVDAKDYPTLLQAFERLLSMEMPARLTFIGDGPEKEALEKLASALNIQQAVCFAGFRDDVQEWLEQADVVVFSSVREGTPVAMLEAMAAGVPVVATRVGGIPDVIDHGISGMLIPSRDSAALAERLRCLAEDSGLRRRLGDGGRLKILESYARDTICCRYEQLFRDLLSAK